MRAEYDAIIKMIISVLTKDLLKKELADNNVAHPLYGHCYVSAEALYHILGGKGSGWKPHRGRDYAGVVHWWLENTDGEILDPTAAQYTDFGFMPPYENGKSGGFLTGAKPSRRTLEIFKRIFDKYGVDLSDMTEANVYSRFAADDDI